MAKQIFSLGLDYENQRVYDRVTGLDLPIVNHWGGGIFSYNYRKW